MVKNIFHHFRSHYAVGAPKSKNALGVVYICHSCFTEEHDSSKDLTIEGDEDSLSFGSRFGQALAAVNIDGQDGNGRDELVVGAPLHSETEKYDVGKVKVFRFEKSSGGRRWQWVEVKDFSPTDLTSGSRFGSVVENLGDIHNDGFEDFAVSAPYFGKDKAGAVFIYRGHPEFIFGTYTVNILTEILMNFGCDPVPDALQSYYIKNMS